MLAGCADGGAWDQTDQSHGRTPLAPPEDVYKLVCAYQPPYWKNYHPEKADRIEGFKFNLYVISRETGRGIHTRGLLQTRMFCRKRRPDGTVERQEMCAWTQPLEDTPRTTREFALGWAYQPHYDWGDADVAGKEVEVVVWYESPTGRRVYAQTQYLKVPAPRQQRWPAADPLAGEKS